MEDGELAKLRRGVVSDAGRMKKSSPPGKHQGLSTSCAPRSGSGPGARRRFFLESPGGGGRRPSSFRQNPASSAILLRARWMSANSMPPPQIQHRLRAHPKGTGLPRPGRGGRRAASSLQHEEGLLPKAHQTEAPPTMLKPAVGSHPPPAQALDAHLPTVLEQGSSTRRP